MYRFWVNGSVIYTRFGRIGASEHRIREWLGDAGIFLRWWDTLTIYSSATGFSDVYLQSSILETLYNDAANDPDPALGLLDQPRKVDPMEAIMPLSETAREILEWFRETHRKPGARMTMATLDARFGTDPSVAVAVSKLKQLGYISVPDARTVELTDVGFDAIQRRSG
ncbi:hypothetical protein [Bradyrhizobium sp. BR 10289]|uniref:hypothetical protein n=1 Tax=Bradyrhizobium sp. BR 10289 TaxID=2749993 RepID=UPI001E62A16F|nr:hypothetical protein [Bradyrhizobium sp. BR 10289]